MTAARKYIPTPPARQSQTRTRKTAAQRRDEQAAFVADRAFVPWVNVEALHKSDETDAGVLHNDLLDLLRTKRLYGRRVDGVYLVSAQPFPPLTGPSMVAGVGERRDDCRLASECLWRFVQSKPRVADLPTADRKKLRLMGGSGSVPCRCPDGCTSYAAVEQHERVGASMLGGTSALGMAQEPIAETGDEE